jgi:hypothetical protein
MIRNLFPQSMNLRQENAISIPVEEFDDTFATIGELLAYDSDPNDLVVDDPFLSSSSVKVDLRKHLQSLYNRMSDIKSTITNSTQMVTIEFH